MTKFQLMSLFLNMVRGHFVSSGGTRFSGVISSLQLEDGSGRSFNVCLFGGQKFHIRTID